MNDRMEELRGRYVVQVLSGEASERETATVKVDLQWRAGGPGDR